MLVGLNRKSYFTPIFDGSDRFYYPPTAEFIVRVHWNILLSAVELFSLCFILNGQRVIKNGVIDGYSTNTIG